MNNPHLRQQVQDRLAAFATLPLREAAVRLLQTLGYSSPRRIEIKQKTSSEFERLFVPKAFDTESLRFPDWIAFDFVFQLTGEEIRITSQDEFVFESSTGVDRSIDKSYLFFVIELQPTENRTGKRKGYNYARGELSEITRAVNRLFHQPAMLIFKHGESITLSIINRRLHKRVSQKDVMEKVTLIKDIRLSNTHRAHLDILSDLSIQDLFGRFGFKDFQGLHDSWRRTLDTTELNKRFYGELANWYFWALQNAKFPPDAEKDVEDRDSISIIRLLTRLIFCWFLKEKGLIPAALFHEERVKDLTTLDADSNTYYTAILQNLFFATLNTEMDQPGKARSRRFVDESSTSDHMVHTLWRYRKRIKDQAKFETLMRQIPFLNGGLFECLDERVEHHKGTREIRIDGFSSKPAKQPQVPNYLFFGEEQATDLSKAYGEMRYRHVRVWPLISLLHRYKFTVSENTPLEEEVALDPELLGHVFENLLAMYNPETDEVARKTTGSFYTPRVVVDFMVDESLRTYLYTRLEKAGHTAKDLEQDLRALLSYEEPAHPFPAPKVAQLLDAIDHVRVLDPACGSGAFPMGTLHKLVFLLGKLDPGNQGWRALQIAKARQLDVGREAAIAAVEDAFDRDRGDYGRKLFLIENCLYGVDIQPIAVQIAKLRFFISLIVDQEPDDTLPNRGITPLPNLETNLIAANTLVRIHIADDAGDDQFFSDPEVDRLQQEIRHVRHEHFRARNYRDKKALRRRDRELRDDLAELLSNSLAPHEAEIVARWDPYHPDVSAPYFDPKWMFNLAPAQTALGDVRTEGFDIVIGNPPYVRQEQVKRMKAFEGVPKLEAPLKDVLKEDYYCHTGSSDLYVYFYEKAVDLLAPGGVLCFISSNKYFRAAYGEKLRRLLGGAMQVHLLVDFGDAQVFTAIAYPSIIVSQKIRETRNKSLLTSTLKKNWEELMPKNVTVRMLNWQPQTGEQIEQFPEKVRTDAMLLPQIELQPDGWRLETPEKLRLLEKLRNAGPTLGEYVHGRLLYGIKTGYNEAFVVNRETRDKLIREHKSSAELLKPFLRGRDVKRWRVDFADYYLIKIESSENKNHPWTGKAADEAEKIFEINFPAIFRRFKPLRDQLINRTDQGRYYWELRSCNYWEEFDRPKIVYPDIYEHQSYVFDKGGYILANTAYFIPSAPLWLTALLNSTTVEWYYGLLSNKVRGGYLRSFTDTMQNIPVAKLGAIEFRAETLISLIQAAKARDRHAFVEDHEAELDALIATAFDLSFQEYKLVLKDLGASAPFELNCLNWYQRLKRLTAV